MSDLQLVIGNRNYSSWSLRAWLALTKSGASGDHCQQVLADADLRRWIDLALREEWVIDQDAAGESPG